MKTLVWKAIPRWGMLTLAAFVVCAITGVMLVPAFSPAAALDSLSLLLLKNPVGVYVRSLHYWSAQVFLVLTIVHMVDHLLRRTDISMRFAVWLRVVLSIPVIAGVMLSGFLLRGDAAALQALAVLRTLLHLVPFAGTALVRLLTGSGHDLVTVYLHHACTATILIWLVTVDHARRMMPTARSLVYVLPPLLILSALLVPALAWRSTAVEKGPWYLLGLQEILHWLPTPRLFLWLLAFALGLFALLPRLSAAQRPALLASFAVAAIAYAALGLMAFAFRGDGWRFASPAAVLGQHTTFVSPRVFFTGDTALLRAPVPLVSGRREGCLACHAAMSGFIPAHDPAAIGCSSCHLGNPWTLNKTLAHSGMTRTPGNLSAIQRTCGNSNCHSDVADRVQGSLMNSMSGIVSVDKYVFGENENLDASFNVARLGHSAADTHLRELCASCHLGQEKQHPAPISATERGGGCSACHLDYDAAARRDLQTASAGKAPLHHPGISIGVRSEACFGCHSRSGRISTNYEGWHETLLDEKSASMQPGWPARYRLLDDGRVFERRTADVHAEAGMTCVDCHLASEVMGDGRAHAHEDNATRIECIDCHAPATPPVRSFAQLDPETAQIVSMRRLNVTGRQFVVTRSTSTAYPNVFLDSANRPQVALMESGKLLAPKPLAAVCASSIHQRLTCSACHTAWAPQCIQCHTSFNPSAQGWDHLAAKWVRGSWQEEPANYLGDAPSLGIALRTLPGGQSEERIAPFIPGMVLQLDVPASNGKQRTVFRRLFAPASPHTTVTKARDCKSCHTDPVALGYGRGTLTYVVSGTSASWRFTPQYPTRTEDGLPQDAWIGFLAQPAGAAATRNGARPFTLDEQRRILLVGACLQCHNANERRVAAVFANFSNYRAMLSARCTVPAW